MRRKMIDNGRKTTNYLSLFFLLLIVSCSKEKIGFTHDNRMITAAMEPSNVRIVNLHWFNQVEADGDRLTNFIFNQPDSENEFDYPGTKYFPEGGRLGKLWNMPQELFGQRGVANLRLSFMGVLGSPDPLELELENSNEPVDYYLSEPAILDKGAVVKRVPRDITSPSKADHFKIRLINLSAPGVRDNFEDVHGPLSLTWADGSSISDKLENVAPGDHSDYVELPYGTYQFKVRTPAGTQVTGKWSRTLLLDPPSSSVVPGDSKDDSGVIYAPIYSYKPGGVYTIVISPKEFNYPYPEGGPGMTLSGFQNAFEIIVDNAEAANLTYARVQFVNALPFADEATFALKGLATKTEHLAYATCGDYQSVIAGEYVIDVETPAGTVTEKYRIEADRNYTVWLFHDGERVALRVVSNHLGGDRFTGTDGEDASFDRMRDAFHFKLRFLNLHAGYPHVTFTGADGQAFGGAVAAKENLAPGEVRETDPYVWIQQLHAPIVVMTYRSSPGVVPGSWASEVPLLGKLQFIARPELYVRGVIPEFEQGTYTVALIGSGDQPSGDFPPRMFIVKHIK